MSAKSERPVERLRQRRDVERRNLFARLPKSYSASRKQGQKILKEAGLSIVEWRTLWDLSVVGSLTVRDLADIQSADHSLLSRALPEMRRKGLVSMRRDDSDGRQSIVELTAEGRAAYQRAAPMMKRRREALRAKFTDAELTNFVEYLDRLDGFLREPIDEILAEKEPAE